MAGINENVPEEKRNALLKAIQSPESETSKIILSKARQRGWLREAEQQATADKASEPEFRPYGEVIGDALTSGPGKSVRGFVQGVGEAANLPALPGSIERLGRAGTNIVFGERQPNDGLVGKVIRSFDEADKNAILPQPTVAETAAWVRSVPGIIASPFTRKSVRDVYGEALATQKEFGGVNETAEMAGQLTNAVPALIAGGKGIMSGVKAAKKTAKGLANTIKAAKTEAGAINATLKEVFQKVDGEIVDAILKRPEKVKELLNKNKLSVDDLRKTILTKMVAAKDKLGKTVGEFRKAAEADDIDKIPTKPFLKKIADLENAFKQKGQQVTKMVDSSLLDDLGRPLKTSKVLNIPGATSLRPKEVSELNSLKELLAKNKLSPRETLNLLDNMDGIGDPALAARGVVSNKFSFEIRNLRRAIKDDLRNTTPNMREWIAADNAYSDFVDASDPVIKKLSSNSANSFVDSILNKNKEPLMEQLGKALGQTGKVFDDTGLLKSFQDNLAELKAAQGLRARVLGTSDPIADNIARIIAKHRFKGENIGTITGGLAGAIGGTAGGSIMGPFGGLAGGAGGSLSLGKIGRAAGSMLGQRYGERMADPMRLLELAKESAQVSKTTKELATDLIPVAKAMGRDGVIAALASIGPNKAVSELIDLSKQGEQ